MAWKQIILAIAVIYNIIAKTLINKIISITLVIGIITIMKGRKKHGIK